MNNDVNKSTDDVRNREDDGIGFFGKLMMKLGLWSPPSIRDDIEDALADAEPNDDISPRERDMLRNVLGLRTRRVDDIMVPRADIVAVGIDMTLGDLLRMFREEGHSRVPVFSETLDDPRGMIHIRDFVDYIASQAEKPAEVSHRKLGQLRAGLGKIDLTTALSAVDILRPVLFVPPSMPALDLLVKMQATRTHMALVIDEYGGTDGLVSIEDIVEIIVGDIEDEHDEEEGEMIVKSDDGTFIVDARANLEDVTRFVQLDLDLIEDVEDVDTVGGLIGMLAGRVPLRGEIIPGPGKFEFQILDADPRRLKRARIQPKTLVDGLPRRRRGSDKAHESDSPVDTRDDKLSDSSGSP